MLFTPYAFSPPMPLAARPASGVPKLDDTRLCCLMDLPPMLLMPSPGFWRSLDAIEKKGSWKCHKSHKIAKCLPPPLGTLPISGNIRPDHGLVTLVTTDLPLLVKQKQLRLVGCQLRRQGRFNEGQPLGESLSVVDHQHFL